MARSLGQHGYFGYSSHEMVAFPCNSGMSWGHQCPELHLAWSSSNTVASTPDLPPQQFSGTVDTQCSIVDHRGQQGAVENWLTCRGHVQPHPGRQAGCRATPEPGSTRARVTGVLVLRCVCMRDCPVIILLMKTQHCHTHFHIHKRLVAVLQARAGPTVRRCIPDASAVAFCLLGPEDSAGFSLKHGWIAFQQTSTA